MGWTEEQALAADVNAIQVAYEGRMGMLGAIFGRGGSKPAEKTAKMTPGLFRAMFGKM